MLTGLFRIDGSRENDEFFAASRSSVSLVYAGLDFRVGASGWVPDLVKVAIAEQEGRCSLTLIELEATKSVALISCRKYLPENANEIVAAFGAYLDRVIRQCKSNAHPHEPEFIHLKELLSQAKEIVVTTAGALRSSTFFVEELPLMGQPGLVAALPQVKQDLLEERERVFHGLLRLSQQDGRALMRSVVVLDAIVRQDHHSAATFHAWRAKSPLRQLLSKDGQGRPELRKLVLETQNRGVTLDFEKVLSELAELWSASWRDAEDRERIRAVINSYYPVGAAIKGLDRMAAVFEEALKHGPNTEG